MFIDLSLSKRGAADHPVSTKTAQLIRRTKQFLAAELANPIRLVDIGRAVKASPGYLTELFRRVEGLSLHQYLIQLRLSHAVAALRDADDLTTLALDVGFSSHSHFSSAFRRAFGCTPSQFRRTARREGRVSSVANQKSVAEFSARGARLARRDDRAYCAYVSEEQRRQAGVPAARTVRGGVETGCPARKMATDF